MEEEIKKVAEQIFVNPRVAQRIVDAVVSNKPTGWSSRSNAPYYKSIYAEEIRPYIDQMILDGQDIIYRYSVWCKDDNMSPQTVYNRVNQSIRYLCEKSLPLEDRKKYIDWYERVHVARDRGVGVRIRFIAQSPADDSPRPESVAPVTQAPLWCRKMDEWLEDSDDFEPFIKDNLALSPEDIVSLKTRLAQLKSVQASITERRVAIIRLG